MYPTFVELCDLPQPDHKLEGRSIAATLSDPKSAKDRNVILPYMEPGEYAIINRDWRYIHYADGDELYDVHTDPNEWNNLATNTDYHNVIAHLKKSAPTTFASPMPKLNVRKNLIIEDGTFRWQTATRK